MMGVEPAADAGDRRAEREGRDLERAHVEAHQVGDALVVVHRGDGDAEPRREQQPDQDRHAARRTAATVGSRMKAVTG